MKKILTLAAVLFLSLPAALLAEEILLEEYEITGNIEEINLEPAPASSPTKRNPKKATSYERPASRSSQQVGEVEVSIDKRVKIAPAFTAEPREGTFRVGLVGPGIYVGNKGIDTMMGIGAEGEYFIFERLSAGMKIQVATDFASNNELNSILSFIPQARYLFDFDSHPRWTAYVQAGAGIALLDGSSVAADIAIPGGGIWWQYNEKLSIGLDLSLHILARSSTAVAFFAGPAFRYQF
ncbi:MAG: hypothetical protein BWY40_00879 [bacterium ADurb.Bin270]|jgi:hypothetical protein|nr:hypothetical protein [Myxococcales bacterium]OQA60790.1 MAG: hypothetical protein BWY40_00879 [bacterium ADurb.Bin270]HQG13327.1 hypothetical protein [bacterium]HQH80293.1 hypothetical protein [bacterium]